MYTLTCEVSVVTGVPNIAWMYNDTKVIEESGIKLTLEENGLDSRLILQFSPLDYDHAGVYTCTANLTIQEFMFYGFNEASQTVNVQSEFDKLQTIVLTRLVIIKALSDAYIVSIMLDTYMHIYIHIHAYIYTYITYIHTLHTYIHTHSYMLDKE